MFTSHSAQIATQRSEPNGLNLQAAIAEIKRRNAALALAVVTRDLLKKRPDDAVASRLRILKAWERDARHQALAPFVESWNYWRRFYAKGDVHPWRPTTPGQLTAMESVVEIAREQRIEVDLLIACFHRQWGWLKETPRLTLLVANAITYYNDQVDAVIVDQDELAYRERCLNE